MPRKTPRKTLNWLAPGARKSLCQRQVGTSGEGKYERHVGENVTFTFLFSGMVTALRVPRESRPQGWAPARPPPGQQARCSFTLCGHWCPAGSRGSPGPAGGVHLLCSARVCLWLWTAGSWKCVVCLSPAGQATAVSEGVGFWPALPLSKPSILYLLSPQGWIGRVGRG